MSSRVRQTMLRERSRYCRCMNQELCFSSMLRNPWQTSRCRRGRWRRPQAIAGTTSNAYQQQLLARSLPYRSSSKEVVSFKHVPYQSSAIHSSSSGIFEPHISALRSVHLTSAAQPTTSSMDSYGSKSVLTTVLGHYSRLRVQPEACSVDDHLAARYSRLSSIDSSREGCLEGLLKRRT